MPIRIEKISIKNCGPLRDFSCELSDVNLIYSENEKGKSYLVEFIIHSLFRNKSYWRNLREVGQGKVIVSGIDKRPIEFSPSTRRKIEEYFEKYKKGLPLLLCNFLVVKEGQTEIVQNSGGVDKNVFRQIFSPRIVLERIEKKISATVKSARISGGEIIINRQGEGREYYELKEKLNKVEELIKQICREYEQGEIKDLEIKKEKLLAEKHLLYRAKRYEAFCLSEKLRELRKKEEKISESIGKLSSLIEEYLDLTKNLERLTLEISQLSTKTQKLPELTDKYEKLLKAKKHKAFCIWEEIKEINERLLELSEQQLSQLNGAIFQYKYKANEKEDKVKLINQLKEKSKDYVWLKKAKENYNKWFFSDLKPSKTTAVLPFISGLLLLVGISLIFFDYRLFGITLLVLSGLFNFYFFFKFKSFVKNQRQAEELKNIKDEFFRRFVFELKSLTDLEAVLDEQEKSYYELEAYEKEVVKMTTDLNLMRKKIEEAFTSLGIKEFDEARWSEKYSELNKERTALIEKRERLKEKLHELEVDEWEYETVNPGIEFNKKEFEEVEKEITGLKNLKEEQIKKENEKLQLEAKLLEIKDRIREVFKKIGQYLEESEWRNKYEDLKQQKAEVEREIKKIEGRLEGLGVSEYEFEREDPKVVFSQQKVDELERELFKLEEEIKAKNEELHRLKDRIIQLTGIEISANWNEMIEKVYAKRRELQEKLEACEATIISGIFLNETIKELNKQEDEKLLERINSPEITRLMERFTGRYKSLSFSIFYQQQNLSIRDENDIMISDEHSTFKIKDLSTGAKEQVMIALRIGFAKSILRGETAFLILDDAFQRSDYKRRPLLIETLIELANNSWQTIYLTMDDHIRNLFIEKVYSREVNFKEINLI